MLFTPKVYSQGLTLSLVLAPVGLQKHPVAVYIAVPIIALVNVAVRPREFSNARFKTVLELAGFNQIRVPLVNGPISSHFLAESILQVVFSAALVFRAVAVQIEAVSMRLVVLPLANVHFPVAVDYSAMA